MLKITETGLSGVLVLEYDIKHDNRGKKQNSFSKRELIEAGIEFDCVEETIYYPEKQGSLYGIHFQNKPYEHSKIVFCIKGKGIDYIVDLRKNSVSYKQWIQIELTSSDIKQILIPKGYGHAFLSLTDDTELVFRIDNYFNPDYSRAISWLDPDLNISFNITNPILSKQDIQAPFLRDSDCNL